MSNMNKNTGKTTFTLFVSLQRLNGLISGLHLPLRRSRLRSYSFNPQNSDCRFSFATSERVLVCQAASKCPDFVTR